MAKATKKAAAAAPEISGGDAPKTPGDIAPVALADAVAEAGAEAMAQGRADPTTPGWPGIAAGLAARIGGTIRIPDGTDEEKRPKVKDVKLSGEHVLAAANRDGKLRVVLADGRRVEIAA